MMNNTTTMNNTEIRTHNRKARPIKCNEDGKIFSSILAAAKYYGISSGNIGHVLTGRRNHTNKLTFSYIDDNGNPIEVEKPVEVDKPKPTKEITVQKEAIMTAEGKRDGGNCEPCMCITDGLCFTSMTDAAEHYGVNVCQISYACKVPGRKAAGREFCSTKDIRLHLNRFSDAINKANAYDILVEKERTRKELIANVDKCQDEVYAIELKLCEAKKALEQAKQSLATFN